MISQLNSSFFAAFYAFAPNGRQIGKAAKEILKEAPKYADDVARAVSKNKNIFQIVPSWIWWIIGIIAVIAIGIAIYRDNN